MEHRLLHHLCITKEANLSQASPKTFPKSRALSSFVSSCKVQVKVEWTCNKYWLIFGNFHNDPPGYAESKVGNDRHLVLWDLKLQLCFENFCQKLRISMSNPLLQEACMAYSFASNLHAFSEICRLETCVIRSFAAESKCQVCFWFRLEKLTACESLTT